MQRPHVANVRLSDAEYEALVALAEAEGRSISELVREALRERIARPQRIAA
jgi:hypothetical protein